MALPFVTRAPSVAEASLLCLMISTFSDGSGNQREADGTSRAGWRELERVFAEFLTGAPHSEDKHVFDVLAPDWDAVETVYGLSIKSKQLAGRATPFNGHPAARAYLEIANSPAKMWEGITARTGRVAADFQARRHAQEIGDALLQTISSWKLAAKAAFDAGSNPRRLDLEHSVYLNISWSPYNGVNRDIHLCSFGMLFPDVEWRYGSERCLRGYDPRYPNTPLLDWYALSGGQLKYYPLFADAMFSTDVLTLRALDSLSIYQKAVQYFEDEYEALARELEPKQISLLSRLLREV